MGDDHEVSLNSKHWFEIVNNFKKYREDNFLCDVVIFSKSKQFKAHSLLLATTSSVFHSIFKFDSKPGLHQVNLLGVEDDHVEIFLDYVYTNRVSLPLDYVDQDKYSSFLQSMKHLGLDILKLKSCFIKFNRTYTAEKNSKVLQHKPDMIKTIVLQVDQTESVQAVPELQHRGSNQSARVNTEEAYFISGSPNKDRNFHIDLPRLINKTEFTKAMPKLPPNLTVSQNVHQSVTKKSETSVITALPNNELNSQLNVLKDILICDVQHVNVEKICCETCQKSFSSKKQLDDHVTSTHSMQCVYCGQAFDDNKTFRLHIREHIEKSKELPFVCPSASCNKRFMYRSSFDNHVRIHVPYVCPVCDKNFQSQTHFKRHADVHTGKKEYICDKCGEGFSQKVNLNCHVLHIHNEERSHQCEQCEASFKTAHALKKHTSAVHAKIASGDNDVEIIDTCLFVCETCDKNFSFEKSLHLHMRSHSNERLHQCGHCDARFKSLVILQRHCRQLHCEDKPFACQSCQKCFKTKFLLSKHTLCHINDRSFGCDTCQAKFKLKVYLERHVKRMHSVG